MSDPIRSPEHLKILLRRTLGCVVWIGIAWAGWHHFGREFFLGSPDRTPVAEQLWSFSTTPVQFVELDYPANMLTAIGDPVFIRDADGGFRQVGYIDKLDDLATADNVSKAYVQASRMRVRGLGPDELMNCRLVYYRTPDNMAWVLETMLPAERRRKIARELNQAFQAHREQILAELKPIIRDSMRDVIFVLEKQLETSMRKRRNEIEHLSGRYQRELVDKEILPLVREQIWPIVLKRGQPVANEIGLDIWERVSVWRFTWRYLADLAPLTEKKRFQQEWDRFVQQEAIPELDQHSDQLIKLVKSILTDVAKNREVQRAFRRNMQAIIDDPELQRIVWRIMQDVLADPEPWRAVMEKHWNSPTTRAAFQIAADRLEPAAQKIGEQLLGTPDGGITPEFAQVLRNRILFKDRRWFVLESMEKSDSPESRSQPSLEPMSISVRSGGFPLETPFSLDVSPLHE